MHDHKLQLVTGDTQANARTVDAVTGGSSDYTISSAERVVFVRFGRKLTARDIAEYAAALRQDPAFDAGFSELVDLTQVEELVLGAEQAMELADHIDPFSYESKRAFVTRNPAMIHAARMHQILRRAPKNIAIFDSIEKAERWLGIAAPNSSH